MAATHGAPPLPPRSPGKATSSESGNYSSLLPSPDDPRRSSTQSLLPSEPRTVEKRTLMLVYIHGFMGAETSFRSFPAHLHNLVTITLADSHVIHTKIYPRYRSRRSIEQVAEDFSKWLSPHESSTTDVVLLSHSMGGLVATEVELLPAASISPGHTFRHRIIGNINFDVPYLGMHPGVVSAGLGSMFHSAPQPPETMYDSDGGPLSTTSSLTVDSLSTAGSSRPARQDTLFSPPLDPNFNPKFANDVILPVRKGWQNAMHFMNKHSDNLRKATKQLVKSHVEFGGAMADYSGLRLRYMKVRALEDEDVTIRKRLAHQTENPARIRFVNYYTSSGRKKKEKSRSRSRSRSPYGQFLDSTTSLGQTLHSRNRSTQSVTSQVSLSPRISVQEHVGGSVVSKGDLQSPIEPSGTPVPSGSDSKELSDLDEHAKNIHVQMPNLPPLPPPPVQPTPLDLTPYPDEEARKLIQKENERQIRAYKQALADREAALNDRKQLENKLRRLAISKLQDEHKKVSDEGSPDAPEERAAMIEQSTEGEPIQPVAEATKSTAPEREGVPESGTQTPPDAVSMTTIDEEDTRSSPEPKPKKDRKFCVLPKKINGERDPLWVRVFMDNHDEVSAHTGLFFMSETYERLVGDIGARIEEWVRDDMTRRMIDDYAT